ncbi:hypothetical protein AKJ09_03207 [Labilithrix luteola]|uniref:Uncharacterized protein n=1 Tax=Labilithrix luteola TaxID=1391654 RepID=A0A0K1PSN0_9BACT|nr:hypothetical protein AKJ09_03207 [Labilithrix luteola]
MKSRRARGYRQRKTSAHIRRFFTLRDEESSVVSSPFVAVVFVSMASTSSFRTT